VSNVDHRPFRLQPVLTTPHLHGNSGETSSGKSENRRLALKSIIELSVSNPGKKGSKLASQIPSAEFVLESFGNARTMYNPNASRFGKYTELQFTERGRLCGVKTLDYYLEKNRVSGFPSGERNFHIFYYLLAGATQEERQHLHLLDKATYRYLGPYRRPLSTDEDGNRFDQLKIALKAIGLSKRQVAQTCQLLASILHLGNLDFVLDKHRNEDAAVVRNVDILEIVAEFLGVPASDLESVLSYKTKLVKKELCTVFLDEEGAAANRDDLAKTLYSLLFAWLNESINEKLCRDDFSTFIGLFDLPGTQNLPQGAVRANSLDQFCVNFANERLQNWTLKRIFDRHTDEYNAEGIQQFSPSVTFNDNSECVRMITHHTGGLIHIMDDQARRASKKTEHTMLEAFSKRWANHSAYKTGGTDRSGFPTFTVSHYNGPVTYSSESWLEKNHDALNPDFVSLLRGSSVAAASEQPGSNNPFIQGLFSAQAIATEAHPRNQETIVAAKQPVKPMRAPSTKRKQTIRRANTQKRKPGDADIAEEEDDAPNAIKCVAGEFNTSLTLLLETLDETESWFVFCINPNDSQLPNQMEGRAVKAQVRSMGLPEIAKKCGTMLEVNMTFNEFFDRYKAHLEQIGVSQFADGTVSERVAKVKSAMGLDYNDIIIGHTKVCFYPIMASLHLNTLL
jgi:chitin synthase